MTTLPQNRAGIGIAFILIGIFCISINDMLIKQLSGGYPLHEIVFVRSAIGLMITLCIVQFEGGWSILRTSTPWLHATRGLLIVISNMSYFVALAALPLADATALFFVAPLFITVLSIPLLGEKVGPLRIGAVLVGFIGVVIMQRPWADASELEVSRLVLLLPVLSALTYALNQLMTRKLGVTSKASALSVYIQVTFILVSLLFFLVAGDGRFAEGTTNPSLLFLLRAWVWPAPEDIWAFVGLGLNSAAVGYCLSQAYRSADAATVAPFEYAGLPLAVFWGWAIFAELPVLEVWVGIILILSSGLFVFVREQQKARVISRGKVKLR
ncbi:S-adenosylmethionine uptake transporter [Pseudosulfitobacter pseudonitzschiae]|uniref:Membrane protein n=1 Tax=Pseudosulfitobacter pseudonitzschiae TaxID=1402135 RepID=A0A073JGA1_9RHOB|nr:DMT family transporter [Pseudosulfitobacter pseudonitzschiae]KEJ96742.1 membrane protein [Pseudosulfitobacter pseudonitzschiae]QKS07804.1 DMT family transporter [Pseudosulfitobacter pseudonitzschiae]SHF25843.1 S-adenosylmethionine uptake transporter [Pseudosulfitobacter pseudonitzschiae]